FKIFFSSRRRHTRCSRDWSSDVCSSDLGDVRAVPTWNYTAVHLAGVPELVDTPANLKVLDDLVAHFERKLPQPRMMWQAPNTEEDRKIVVQGLSLSLGAVTTR